MMADRIDEVARNRAVQATKKQDPWWRVILNLILAMLFAALSIAIAGFLCWVIWQLFLLGWRGI